MDAIVSVHDVMPHTMGFIEQILEKLTLFPTDKIVLLVVPGRNWSKEQIAQLHQWQQAGYELAGHGWTHETTHISTLYHQIHSRVISKNVAEHLSISATEVMSLMECNYYWWYVHQFQLPELYVPPSWAMGKVSRAQLAELPFRYYEDFGGIFDAQSDRYRRLPLMGFEVEKKWETTFVQGWNWVNSKGCCSQRPVRISLHPYDFEKKLRDTILPYLKQVTAWRDYRTIF